VSTVESNAKRSHPTAACSHGNMKGLITVNFHVRIHAAGILSNTLHNIYRSNKPTSGQAN
jgi:hypothetical protein